MPQSANGVYTAFLHARPISVNDFRIVNSSGAVGDTATGNGGLLSSNTSPSLGAETTTEAMAIIWAAGNSAIVQAQVTLPPNFDGRSDVTLDLWILTDNTGGGSIEAGTFSVLTSWDNGAQVTDTATDSVPATTSHKITATIAASDIPDTAAYVNIQLVLGTHANDPIHLLAARLSYFPRSTEV